MLKFKKKKYDACFLKRLRLFAKWYYKSDLSRDFFGILIAASFFMLINLNTRQCSNIKEVVVDHGSLFEIISRYDLLKNIDLEKFKCRHADVKRSKQSVESKLFR
ncbi:hypothetical protein BD770DRAFT_413961 [Pilaira anomala]|nr:hypothetical protein BD770DRAFT_413961 [Pilaira anomala]